MVGLRIKEFRKKQGLSLATLAKKAEVSQHHLKSLEAGKAQPEPVLRKLAKALGVTVEELVK